MKFPHPILFWHPNLVGLWVGAGLLCLGMSEIVRSVDRSAQVHRGIAAAEAALAAEEAAFAFAGEHLAEDSYQASSGLTCKLNMPVATAAASMEILINDRFGVAHRFGYDLLAGGIPRALGQAFSALERSTSMPRRISITASPPVPIPEDQWPRLDPTVFELSPNNWRRTGILKKNASIALLRLPGGTDRPDFVLGSRGETLLSATIPSSGVVRLDGHLWVEPDDKPLVLELSADLTIAVRGNLYLGRSIHVRGPGRLVLIVVRRRGDMFRDLDLDGRWSEGDELLTAHDRPFQGSTDGSGTVYIGLPANNRVPDRIRLDAALIADGEVHIQTSVAEVWGALAVGYGVTGAAEGCRLLTPGLLLPDTHRERVPGLQPRGRPRPGILRPL